MPHALRRQAGRVEIDPRHMELVVVRAQLGDRQGRIVDPIAAGRRGVGRSRGDGAVVVGVTKGLPPRFV
jgi:hypothetical protein